MPIKSTTNRNIKVSISLVTYNHEKYITRAIDSILMQNVNFDYEIIIGEDCSSDRTREIVKEYQRKYPDKIRLILPQKNLGNYGQKIFVKTLKACQGEYIALLDGDDYWLDPNKLQAQVDFLDRHVDCAICFHDVIKLYEDKDRKISKYNHFQPKPFSTIKDILKSNFIPTCATMYRNKLFDQYPKWYCSLVCGDWILHVLNARYGKIGYINKVMGVYRVHSNGLFSSMKKRRQLQEEIKCYDRLNNYLDFRYNHLIRSEKAYRYYSLAKTYQEEGDLLTANEYRSKCFEYLLTEPAIQLVAILKIFKRIFFNQVYARNPLLSLKLILFQEKFFQKQFSSYSDPVSLVNISTIEAENFTVKT